MQSNHTKFKTNLIIFLLGIKSLCACVNTKQGLGANKEDTINPLVNTKSDNLNHTSGICNKKTCFYCKKDHKHSSCNPYNCYYGHHKYFSYTRDFCWGTTKRKIVSTGTGLLSLMIATAPTIYYACAHNINALKIGSSLMQHTYNQPAFLSSGSSSMENITGDALVYVMTTALPTLGTIAAFLPNQLNTNRVTNAEPVERLQATTATNHTIDLLDNEISAELQAESMSLDSVMKYINEGRVSVNAIPRDSSENRYNLLQYAAYGERLDVVEFLITKGADINAQSPGQKVTALHLAAYTRNFDIVDYLLKHGANPCLRDSMNLTASQIASEVAGNQSVVRLLQAAEKKWRQEQKSQYKIPQNLSLNMAYASL